MFSQSGKLIGLVTSNTRHAGSRRSFAKLNYSIASSALVPIIDAVTEQPAAAIDWAALDLQDAAVAAVWELRDGMQRTDRPQMHVQNFKRILQESADQNITGRSGAQQSKL